jgi:trimeric autotransporter adhesin
MKKQFSKGVIALALVMLSWTGLLAQPIDMSTSPINFGYGCFTPYIRSTVAHSNVLQFGYHTGCIGPPADQDRIVMDMTYARIGVGVTAPTYQLQLSSNSAAKPGSNTWTVVSDKRLKENVKGFSDGLAAVRGINPVTFHYNANSGYDTKPEYVGVLAQDLQQVAPYMVQQTQITDETGKANDYLAVDFGAMDFVLVNAVKELDAELQLQKAENEALRTALAEMRAEIAALKASQGQPTSAIVPSIHVAPNPVGNQATIRCTLPAGHQIADIQIIALDGKLLGTMHIDLNRQDAWTLDTQPMPSGTYILKLVTDGKVVATTRLVAQH